MKVVDKIVIGIMIIDAFFILICMMGCWIAGMVVGLIVWIVTYNLAEFLEVKMYQDYYDEISGRIYKNMKERREHED